MRKALAIRLLIATIMLLMLGLSPALAQDDVIELRFMNWWGATREPLMLELIANFEAENPGIKVNNEVQPWENRNQIVATAVSSSTPPNVIMTTRVETFQFAAQGLIIPITEFLETDGVDLSIFYDGEIGNQWWQGDLYSLPMPTAGGLTGMFFYNKTLLADAGFDGPPETWQELEAVAAAVTVGDAMGLEVIGASIVATDQNFIDWLYTNNGKYVSDDARTLLFNSPEGVETLEWMINFTNEINGGIENVTDFYQGAEFTAGDHPWFSNTEAVVAINTSNFNHMNQADPEFYADTDRWGVMFRPYNGNNADATTAGVVGYGVSGGWGYTIPAAQSAEEQEAAYKFSRYIGESPDGGCAFLFAQMRPSSVRACNENPAYYEVNPYWDVVLEGLTYDVAVPITAVQAQIADIMNVKIEEAFFGVKSAEQALNEAVEEGQAILDEFWSGIDG